MSLFESLSREERSAILLSRYAGHPPDEGTELSEALCWFAFDLGLDESYTPPTDTSVDPLLRLEYYIRNILYLFRGWFGQTRVRELFTVICDFPPPMNWTVFYISRRIEDCLREGGHSFGFRKGPSLWVDVEVLESHWGGGTGPNEV